MQTLTIVTEQLKTDYKAKGFSNRSKEAMIDLAEKLDVSAFKDNFRKIINSLEIIHEEGLKEKKGAWVFTKKAYEKKFGAFIKIVAELLASNLGKGFVALDRNSDNNSDDIKPKQTISLNVVQKYFEYISISIIKS